MFSSTRTHTHTHTLHLPSEKSSTEVTESMLCWSLLSESLRRGAAHAPPGWSASQEEQEEEEGGAWWTRTVSA